MSESGSARRVVIGSPGELRLEAAEVPPPGPGEVRLRSLAIGICGSDLHVYAGHHPFVDYPVFPGHEIVAEVTALGADVDEGWRGARVALEPSLVCGRCRACRSGRYNICERLEVMGFQAPGGMADAFVAPVDRLHRLPERMPTSAGALVEPTAVATHAVRLAEEVAGALDGADVAVFGAGTIGLLCACVARASGGTVVVVDPSDARRALAAALGFDTAETLAARAHDVAFECVGVEAALRDAIASARKGATVIVAGVYGRDPATPAGLVQDWELTLRGTLMYTAQDYERAIELLADGTIDADRLITDRYPLAAVERAFDVARGGGSTLKVLLEPSADRPSESGPQSASSATSS